MPLWSETSRVLRMWFQKLECKPDDFAFPTPRRRPFSADSLDYLLQGVVRKAAVHCPSLKKKRVTPHVVRHSTAMGLLQGGVDIAVIALWLGHESIEKTHGYVEADLAMKERALAKLAPAQGRLSRFRAEGRPASILVGSLNNPANTTCDWGRTGGSSAPHSWL